MNIKIELIFSQQTNIVFENLFSKTYMKKHVNGMAKDSLEKR